MTILSHLRLFMHPPFIKITDHFTKMVIIAHWLLRSICSALFINWSGFILAQQMAQQIDRQTSSLKCHDNYRSFLGSFFLTFTNIQILKCRNVYIVPIGVFGTLYIVLSVFLAMLMSLSSVIESLETPFNLRHTFSTFQKPKSVFFFFLGG